VKPCIGLYGIVSYVAARKTNETSIRLALGATRVQVLGSVLKEGMLLVIAGMAISVPATLAATRLITSLLFGVKAADLNSLGLNTPVVRIGWPNRFIEHGRLGLLHAKYGITPEAAIERLRPDLKIHQPDQPEETEADRRELRLAEDDCADAEGATPGHSEGRVGVYFCGRGLQPGADAESAVAGSSVRVSRGRGVSKIAK
jgi:hypothetical protein